MPAKLRPSSSTPICRQHNGPGALLLTPRLDAQTTFAKLFADIGTQEDVRQLTLQPCLQRALHRLPESRLACPGPA